MRSLIGLAHGRGGNSPVAGPIVNWTVNPRFAGNADHWRLSDQSPTQDGIVIAYDAGQSADPTGGSLRLTLTSPGPTVWYVILPVYIAITTGIPYTLSFAMKTDSAVLYPEIELIGYTGPTFGDMDTGEFGTAGGFPVASPWDRQEFSYQWADPSVAYVGVVLGVGIDGAEGVDGVHAWFDNIQFEQAAAATAFTATPAPVVVDVGGVLFAQAAP